jgi:hypothetical protein
VTIASVLKENRTRSIDDRALQHRDVGQSVALDGPSQALEGSWVRFDAYYASRRADEAGEQPGFTPHAGTNIDDRVATPWLVVIEEHVSRVPILSVRRGPAQRGINNYAVPILMDVCAVLVANITMRAGSSRQIDRAELRDQSRIKSSLQRTCQRLPENHSVPPLYQFK